MDDWNPLYPYSHQRPVVYYIERPRSDSKESFRKAGAKLAFIGGIIMIIISVIYLLSLLIIGRKFNEPFQFIIIFYFILISIYLIGGVLILCSGFMAWKKNNWTRCFIFCLIGTIIGLGNVLGILATIFIGISKEAFEKKKDRFDPEQLRVR